MSTELEIFTGDDDTAFRSETSGKYSQVDVKVLKENLEHFTNSLADVIKDSKFDIPGVSIDKVVFSLGVGAAGRISLLGTGVSASTNATIALHFNLKGEDV